MTQKVARWLEVWSLSRIPDDAPVYSMAVAEQMTSLTRRQIRYYEAMGLLRPARTPGNRRLYSAADLRRLNEIKRLLQEGLDLRAVAALAEAGRLDVSGPEETEGPAGRTGPGWPAAHRAGARATQGSEWLRFGPYEDARARFGRGPAGSLDRLYPGDAARLGSPRPTTAPSATGPAAPTASPASRPASRPARPPKTEE